MLQPMSYDERHTDSIDSDKSSIWVVDPKDWPDGDYAGNPDPRGKESEDAWLEKMTLAVLPWVIVFGFAALIILALLGLITFH